MKINFGCCGKARGQAKFWDRLGSYLTCCPEECVIQKNGVHRDHEAAWSLMQDVGQDMSRKTSTVNNAWSCAGTGETGSWAF